MSNWLYQVRIRVSEHLSQFLRNGERYQLADKLQDIAKMHGMKIVNTYDAFKEYCDEAESFGVEAYGLYKWTKDTIENPEKKAKHLKSFAFYEGDFQQIYQKELALNLIASLRKLGHHDDILEIKLIDSNPANNPQPPKS